MGKLKLSNIYKNIIKEQESPESKQASDLEKKAIDLRIRDLQNKKTKLSEEEIEEMANVSIVYQLADKDVDSTKFFAKQQKIINAMKGMQDGVSKIQVAGELGYNKQNPINSDFMDLVRQGVIVPSSEQTAKREIPKYSEPKPNDVPSSDNSEDEDEDELKGIDVNNPDDVDFDSGIIDKDLSDDEIDASFDKAKKSGDDEPEISNIRH